MLVMNVHDGSDAGSQKYTDFTQKVQQFYKIESDSIRKPSLLHKQIKSMTNPKKRQTCL
jgi:hypothetical protein